MHSTGSMKSWSTCSNPGRPSSYCVFFFGWMQSTGQASTQAVSFVPMQGSAITKAISHLRLSQSTVRPKGVGFKRAASFLLPSPDLSEALQWLGSSLEDSNTIGARASRWHYRRFDRQALVERDPFGNVVSVLSPQRSTKKSQRVRWL